jgi:ParB-like chromosome segregation protein Spo0J
MTTTATPGDGAKQNGNPVAPVNGATNNGAITQHDAQERIGKHAVHRLASLFPSITGDEYQAFVDGIKTGGQQLPIIKDQNGLIVDGRNRLRALLDLGIEPNFETRVFENDDELIRYLVNANLTRRHLNAVRRAFLAAKLQETLRPQAAKNQAEGVQPKMAGGQTRDKAGEQCGVGHTYVDKARKAMEVDPRIAKLVNNGKLTSMVDVERLTKLDPELRNAAIEALEKTPPANGKKKATSKKTKKSSSQKQQPSNSSSNAPQSAPIAQPAPVVSPPELPNLDRQIDDTFCDAADLCCRLARLFPVPNKGPWVREHLLEVHGFDRESVEKAIDFFMTLRQIGDDLKWFAPVAS